MHSTSRSPGVNTCAPDGEVDYEYAGAVAAKGGPEGTQEKVANQASAAEAAHENAQKN
jgi:hypothetical protein